MSKTAIALLAIALGSIVMGGTLFAYFSDVESVNSNQYTTGNLNLTLSGTGIVPAGVGPVYPGWGTAQYPASVGSITTITVSNSGSINGVLWLNFTSVTNNDNGISDPESKYNLVPGDCGDSSDGIGNGELQHYMFVSVKYGTTQVFAPVVLDNIGSAGILLGNLPSGGSNTVTITYYVPTTVGNVIQSDSVAFDLTFNLEQGRTAAV